MADPHLEIAELEQLVRGNSALNDDTERHLENCDTCRSQLESIAADQSWWQRANKMLATDTTELPKLPELKSGIIAVTDMDADDGLNTMLDEPTHPELLGSVDQFDVEQCIGRGGFGVVFKGFDRELNRSVAIKFLAPHLASDANARQRFEREARAAAAVAHPHVVPLHTIKSGERPYIVMPLVSGPSLQKYVQENGSLPGKDIVRIGMQIAAGLAAAHKQGLIHRDIKPSNLLIDGDVGRVMITDFGLARAANDVVMTQTGCLAGTPHYMSPEQATGVSIDSRSDLFSLGSVLYFLATGTHPFEADQPLAILQQIANKPHVPVRQRNSDIPHVLADVIDKLLEKSVSDRFASADEVQQSLEKFLAYLQHPGSHDKPRIPWSRRRKRTWLAAATGVAATFAVLVLGKWLWDTRVPSQQPPLVPPTAEIEDAESYAKDRNQLIQDVASAGAAIPIASDISVQKEFLSIEAKIAHLESRWPQLPNTETDAQVPPSASERKE